MAQLNKQVRHREPRSPSRPRAQEYTDRWALLAASLELAKTTIAKARGLPPTEHEIARIRDYPMSPANFERTEGSEKAARAALAEIREGYTKLRHGLEKALALGKWRPSEQGVTLDGEQILIGTQPPKAVRPGGYAAALTFYRHILETSLGSLDPLWRVLQTLKQREASRHVSPAAIRPIDHRDLILFDFDRPVQGQRFKPPELAAWSLLARGTLPDGLVPRRGLTAADVLKTERLAIRKRAKRRGPDPINGSAWAAIGSRGAVDVRVTPKYELDFEVATRNAWKSKSQKEKGVVRKPPK